MSTPVLDSNRQPRNAFRQTTRVRPPTQQNESESAPDAWSPARRAGFRYLFAYLVLYNFPFPLAAIPKADFVSEWYGKLWHLIVPWVGAHVLHLAKPITVFTNGSGDTTYDYVLMLVYVAVAAAVTLVWSAIDRRSLGYPRLARVLRIYVRYVLAFALLAYGAFKVIKTQFPYPGLDRLVEPYGEFSPMGVVWAWMGMSYGYNLFAGLAEMVSGFLLFFRRTTLLGGLLAIAVMSNVVMINFAFDVPVKLYSTHLLLMAVFLVAPDAKRLVDAFGLDRGMRSRQLEPYRFSSRPAHIAVKTVKPMLVLLGVASPLWSSWGFSRQLAARPPLYGIWEVDSFVRGRDSLPALVGDSTRWRRMVVSRPGALSVRLLDDSTRGFLVRVDSTKRILHLTSRRDSSKVELRYARSGSPDDRLQLDGILHGDSVHVLLHRLDESRFLLVNRGYHWINEFPLNR